MMMNTSANSEAAALDCAYPPRAQGWYLIFVLFVATAVSFVDRQLLSLMVQPIKTDLSLTDTQISMLQGFAFVIFYTLMGIVLGRWADRGHRQRLIVFGIVTWSLATASCGLAHNFTELFAARIFVGAGEAALTPAALSLISDYFPRSSRARAMSVFGAGAIAGAGLALVLGGMAVAATSRAPLPALPLLGAVHPWQAAFFLVGLPGVLVALLMLTVPEPSRKETLDSRLGSPGTWKFILSRGSTLPLLCVGFGTLATVVYGIAAWLPTAFIRVHHWAPREIAGVSGIAMLACGIPGLLIAGQIADRIRSRDKPAYLIWVAFGATVAMLPVLPWVGLAGEPRQAIAALCWVDFFAGIASAVAIPALHWITPNDYRGRITAGYLFANTLFGLALGPMLIAIVTDRIFHEELAVGKSIAVVTTTAALVAALLFLLVRKGFAAGVAAGGSPTEPHLRRFAQAATVADTASGPSSAVMRSDFVNAVRGD